MSFLYPLGLLGLIGVPIIILVYIIKSRYTEQTVSSTYLWTLSERFLKKRNPISRITGIISLILQLLLVISLSLAIAHPIITVPGGAREYCFILDGSGSMQTEQDGRTRFELAKEEINNIIDEAKNGSVFSLICVSDMTEVVFEHEDDIDLIKKRIELLSPYDGEVEYTQAIGISQGYFNDDPSIITYLLTDTEYAEHENITLIDVSRGENNISLLDVKYEDAGNGVINVSGNVISYSDDATTDVEVYLGGSDERLGVQTLSLVKNTKTPFSIPCTAGGFYSLDVKLTANDALRLDNTAMIYSIESENAYKALLVSDTPFLLESAVNTVGAADMTVITTEEYENRYAVGESFTGYGLYIFDAFDPPILPTDGSVWFIGPKQSLENTGFSIQGEVELDKGALLELNRSSNSVMKKLTAGMSGDDVYVKKYMKCGVYGNFNTVFSYMGNPIIFTGVGSSGNRQVVFAFDLHDSNFSLSSDYLMLLRNLLDYSFPSVIETVGYDCGDTATVNVISGCQSIRVEAPSGDAVYADASSAVSEFKLSEVGEYKITMDISGAMREFYIFSALPSTEGCADGQSEASVSIRGTALDTGMDAVYDPMALLLVMAAVLFAAEWMVYCYDKYQFL